MAKVKKLGAFGGVFVPSILTILGVIMYLRLPWIVGQAGLLSALGIIFVAHIISITTGLSISSIATDKKVKAGGTYYMISRSMGLPIGGTLGLALFVGLSFSVSLYLIGFAEAFLGFFDMDTSINSVRLTGFIVLSCVTILTFISTKLAIKTQFLILAAMVLSLGSIFFGSHDYSPALPNFFGTGEALPWIVLFGIFFPAVTGFEAGVSMSGDLSNPNKALPRGTISAIAVGLLMYVFLAFFFSFTVRGDVLQNNPNVLFDISRFRYFVVAGIWGATLSSALGSILAAPRILQAISIDKITPRFFAKGYGELNEPRNALILSFIIATAGIMIGELNAIARIVTIFFIITYGFLNLSCFIESWASSDFRPTFKISPAVSIIGAIACFVVMIQLDFLAFVGATLVLAALFFYLKRKELVLRTGDAWNSVWASIVKSGLLRLKNNRLKIRNWRPNIVLFSGGHKNRPYLLEVGTELIGKLGILTDFELIEDEKTQNIISKKEAKEEVVKTDYDNNIFQKKYHCSNIYRGIESISQLYGFSGIEPNTMLLGFPNDRAKIEEFHKIYKVFQKIDYNSIFIKYCKEKGFGKKKNIDFWWEGESNSLVFGIALLRFLTSGFEWRQASCNLIFINNFNIPEENIISNLKAVLNDYRINLKIKVYNNTIEQKKALDIIKEESATTDLVIYDLPNADSKDTVQALNTLVGYTGQMPSCMLINATSDFQKIKLFAGYKKAKPAFYKDVSESLTKLDLTELPHTSNDLLNLHLNDSKMQLEHLLFRFYEAAFIKVQERNMFISKELATIINTSFESLQKTTAIKNAELRKKEFYKIWNDSLFKVKRVTTELLDEMMAADKEQWGLAISELLKGLDEFTATLPEDIKLTFSREDYIPEGNDSITKRLQKKAMRFAFKFKRGKRTEKIAFKKAMALLIRPRLMMHLNSLLIKHQNNTYVSAKELHKLIEQLKNIFYRLEKKLNDDKPEEDIWQNYKEEILTALELNDKNIEEGIGLYKRSIFTSFRREMTTFISQADKPLFSLYLKSNALKEQQYALLKEKLNDYPSLWHDNTVYFARQIYVDVLMQSIAVRIKTKILKSYNEVFENISKSANVTFDAIRERINDYHTQIKSKGDFDYDLDNFSFPEVQLLEIFEDLYVDVKALVDDLPENLTVAEPSFKKHKENALLRTVPPLILPVKSHIDFIIEGKFPEKLNKIIGEYNAALNQKAQKLNNLLSLSRYNIDNIYINENLTLDDEKKNKLAYINEVGKSLEKEKASFEELTNTFDTSLSLVLKEIFEPLTLKYLIVNNKSGDAPEKGRRKQRQFKPLRMAVKLMQKGAERLFYGRSKGILLAQSIKKAPTEQKSAMSQILKFVEDNSPQKEIIDKLPFYYKNLFNNKFTVNKSFWVSRNNELQKAAKAIGHFRKGSKGALMITGERNAGKTSLSNLIAKTHFPPKKIYTVFPLRQGSCSADDFTEALRKALDRPGHPHELMRQIEEGSCIIINDMALWWERSEKGMRVIKLICELIAQYGDKCLFIINANTVSFNFINKLHKLNDYFLDIIKCEPFTTRELRSLILKRHQSSELKFKLGKLPESMMIEWRYAHLFNSYFNYSDGVIGTALNAWLTNIKSFNGKEIIISSPGKADVKAFNTLNKEKLLVISQLVLHRRLNKERLQKILIIKSQELENILQFLHASQMLTKLSNNIYMLNPFVEPHIVKFLISKEIL